MQGNATSDVTVVDTAARGTAALRPLSGQRDGDVESMHTCAHAGCAPARQTHTYDGFARTGPIRAYLPDPHSIVTTLSLLPSEAPR